MIAGRFRIRLLQLVAALVVSTGLGCSLLKEDTPARDESFRDAAGYDRDTAATKTSPWGVSDRSRDIERDLGVH